MDYRFNVGALVPLMPKQRIKHVVYCTVNRIPVVYHAYKTRIEAVNKAWHLNQQRKTQTRILKRISKGG